MGNAGTVILFMLSLTGTAVVGLYLAGYVSHHYLVVVEETASGIDQVKPPDEPFLDWLWKLLFFVWLVAFWVVPAALAAGAVAPALVGDPGGFLALALGVLWLVLPLSLLSCLSGRTMFTVLHAGFLRRVVKQPGALVVFYLTTGLLLAGVGALAYLAYFADRGAALAALPPYWAAAVLIHARLVGRIGWLVGHRTSERARKKKKLKPVRREVHDPWEVPEEELPVVANPEVIDDAPTSHAERRPERPARAYAAKAPAPPASNTEAFRPPPKAGHAPTTVRPGYDPFTADLSALATPSAVAQPGPQGTPETRATPPKASDPASASPPLRPSQPTEAEEEDEWTPNKKPYGVLDDDKARATWAPPREENHLPDEEGYGLAPEQPVTRPPVPLDGHLPVGADRPLSEEFGAAEPPSEGGPESPVRLSRFERWLMDRRRPEKPPAAPLFSGVYEFPWYPSIAGVWIALTAGGYAFCLLLRVLVGAWFLD